MKDSDVPDRPGDLEGLRREFVGVTTRDAKLRTARQRRAGAMLTAACIVLALAGVMFVTRWSGGFDSEAAATVRVASARTLGSPLSFESHFLLRRPNRADLRDVQRGVIDVRAGTGRWATRSGTEVVVQERAIFVRARHRRWLQVARTALGSMIPSLLSVSALRILEKASVARTIPAPVNQNGVAVYRGSTSLTALLAASKLPPIGRKSGEVRVHFRAVLDENRRVLRQDLEAHRGGELVVVRSMYKRATSPLKVSSPPHVRQAVEGHDARFVLDPLLRRLLAAFGD